VADAASPPGRITARADGASIKGFVTDGNGALVVNATVGLQRPAGRGWRSVRTARTGGFGTYSLRGTGPGPYRAIAVVARATVSSSTVRVVPTPAGSDVIVVFKQAVGDPRGLARKQTNRIGKRPSLLFSSAIKGYTARLTRVERRRIAADGNVSAVVPDRAIAANAIVGPPRLVDPGPIQRGPQRIPTGIARVGADRSPTAKIDGVDQRVNVNVAVIDTGIDARVSQLNVVGGKNCAAGPTYSSADNGHGTHVAGTLAAKDDGLGVVGVAPGAPLWSVRVLNEDGTGKWSYVICGLDFVDSKSPAKGGPIRVANMSLGSLGSDTSNCGAGFPVDPLHLMICRVHDDGVTVVVSAGNSSDRVYRYVPANYDQVITATALADYDGKPGSQGPDSCPPVPNASGGMDSVGWGNDDTFAAFSNFPGPSSQDFPHLLGAPGTCILSTLPGGAYGMMDGTSMASPHIAGAAALYIATHPGSTPAGVLAGLRALAEPVGSGHTSPSGNHPEPVLLAGSL
jgi:subtilisin family serine protease